MKHASYIAFVGLLLAANRTAHAYPYPTVTPQIVGNGTSGYVEVYQNESVQIHVSEKWTFDWSFDPDSWWPDRYVVASTPFGWFTYEFERQRWMPGFWSSNPAPYTPSYYRILPSTLVLNSSLPPGVYTVYFGVDWKNSNGVLDEYGFDFDSLMVNVLPGPRP